MTEPAKHPVAVLQQDITARQSDFASALPPHISPAKFMRVALTAITTSKDLHKCNPRSVVMECMKAAQDGLVLDGREAVLVKFSVNVGSKASPKWEDHAKYIPMYAGLMKKARNSGEISTISAHVVYANDLFEFEYGDDERLRHIPTREEPGAPVCAYCIVKLKDGSILREVMSAAQILKIASKTKNAHQYDPDKGDSFAEWWRKTVIRRLSKYMPSSTDKEGGDFFEAVRRDDDLYDPETPAETVPAKPPRKQRAAAAALAAAPAPAQEPEIPEFLDRRGEVETVEADAEADDVI